MDAVSNQARRVALGSDPVRVVATVGPEQEHFLIKRRIIRQAPRPHPHRAYLFRRRTAKGQSPGALLRRHPPHGELLAKELDEEAWKLAIPAKTKSTTRSPHQHSTHLRSRRPTSPSDHNLLVMELMKILASHHGLVCLEHEKPLPASNGSGKHDNWSLAADGTNLLDPGDTPEENLQFLVFLSCIIAAVDEYQDMLRVSVASAGNDHRLGAHEAPPAIIRSSWATSSTPWCRPSSTTPTTSPTARSPWTWACRCSPT